MLDEADRLTEHSDMVLKLWRALPKGGAGAARLQVRAPCAALRRALPDSACLRQPNLAACPQSRNAGSRHPKHHQTATKKTTNKH